MRAEELGADALSIITPSFALASQKELYDHYREVAKHVSIPIVLYNIPARTGNKLLPETVAKLAKDVDVILGAKDSSGDLENLKAYIALTRDIGKDFAVLAGNDGNILNCLKAGGAGQHLAQDHRLHLRQFRGGKPGEGPGGPGRHRGPPAGIQVRQSQHHHQKGRGPAGLSGGGLPQALQLPL